MQDNERHMKTAGSPKVLLIGWDAADWKVIAPLMDAGLMPHLESIVDRGVIGNLATLQPVLSPVLWTSIATGKRQHKHGIHGFSEPDPHTGLIRPVTNLSRKTKAIWNILQQNGRRCHVVGWWPSHPAEPINGVMISNHFQRAVSALDQPWPMQPGTVHPAELSEQLQDLRIHPCELEEEHLLPFVPLAAEIDQSDDGRLMGVAKIIAECSSIHAAATAVMQTEPWDFMAVYYDAIDHFCHGFMKYHPPREPWVPEEGFRLYKDVVAGGYRYHDMMLGTLLELAGPETTVILISDHGFQSDHLRPQQLPNEPAGPASEHRELGVFAMAGPGIRRDERVYGATLLDIAPTVLRLFDLPVGRDMDGRVLADCFEEPGCDEQIDSWDAVPGESGEHAPEAGYDPVESQQALRQLIELGYIDEPDADQEKATSETLRELQYNRARGLIDADMHAEARPILQELWDQWPEEQRFGVRLLACWLAAKNSQQARATFELIRQRKEKYAGLAREELAQLQRQTSEQMSRREERRLERLRARAGTNQAALSYLSAAVLQAEGRHTDALAALEEAAKSQPHNLPSVFLKQGEIHLEQGQWQHARRSFQKVLKIEPGSVGAYLGLARCSLADGRNREAASEALSAIGLVYHNPRGHYLHGIARLRMGEVAAAVDALQTAVAQNPGFPEAQTRLAEILDTEAGCPDEVRVHRPFQQASEAAIRSWDEVPTPDYEGREATAVRASETVATVTSEESDVDPQNVITVVSGLPRSGTSMMMQMLAAGGMDVYTDRVRQPDDNNPRGYFEHENVRKLQGDRSWLPAARGKAVKVIAPLVPWLSPNFAYRVILMERDMEELLASQTRMLDRLNPEERKSDTPDLADAFVRQLAQVRKLVANHPRSALLTVDYHDAVRDPVCVASDVAGFLPLDLDVSAMAAAVDSQLHRERRKSFDRDRECRSAMADGA